MTWTSAEVLSGSKGMMTAMTGARTGSDNCQSPKRHRSKRDNEGFQVLLKIFDRKLQEREKTLEDLFHAF